MPEPTVQVPVSLIKDVRAALGFHVGEQDRLYRQVDALLSQPAPSAEPKPLNPEAMQRALDYHGWPPRIADMAPGTTFTAVGLDLVERRWTVRKDGRLWSGMGVMNTSWVDPSTIRDVRESER